MTKHSQGNGSKGAKGSNRDKGQQSVSSRRTERSPSKKPKVGAKHPKAEPATTIPPKSNKRDPSDFSQGETWSKSKKKRMRKVMAKLKQVSTNGSNVQSLVAASHNNYEIETNPTETPIPDQPKGRSSSIQNAFKARLAGSRFRVLNEELYTTTSQESFVRFSRNPELFEQYHDGFRHQVASWPENPVNVMVRSLVQSYKKTTKTTSHISKCVVADFGCGDAQLAKDLLAVPESPFQVYSFDLVAPNDLVTACDMSNVPLADKTVDVCVFCLSLMGTNLADFVREAHRVLKDNGRVKIAEVRSRIEYSHSKKVESEDKGGDVNKNKKNKFNKYRGKETEQGTLEEFVAVLEQLGFESIRTDRSNKMFLLLELKKSGKKPDTNLAFSAKPCIYKRR